MIGDMMPHNALDHISRNTLMIVPGNREGLVLTALCENLLTQGPHLVSGIVFTNGVKLIRRFLIFYTHLKYHYLWLKRTPSLSQQKSTI